MMPPTLWGPGGRGSSSPLGAGTSQMMRVALPHCYARQDGEKKVDKQQVNMRCTLDLQGLTDQYAEGPRIAGRDSETMRYMSTLPPISSLFQPLWHPTSIRAPPLPPGVACSAPCGDEGPEYARLCALYTECHSVYPCPHPFLCGPSAWRPIVCRRCLPQANVVCQL